MGAGRHRPTAHSHRPPSSGHVATVVVTTDTSIIIRLAPASRIYNRRCAHLLRECSNMYFNVATEKIRNRARDMCMGPGPHHVGL